jgi:hypothetical protein
MPARPTPQEKAETLAWLRRISGDLATATIKRLEESLPTLRSSSRGAAAKMSAAIHGVDCGSSYHWMNDAMPACATR